jgi:hypothetical protein
MTVMATSQTQRNACWQVFWFGRIVEMVALPVGANVQQPQSPRLCLGQDLSRIASAVGLVGSLILCAFISAGSGAEAAPTYSRGSMRPTESIADPKDVLTNLAAQHQLDAFFASSTKTLYVINPARFSEGIRAGHFAVKWPPGSISALVVGIGPLDVQVIKDLIDWLRNPPPLKIGDIAYVELAETLSFPSETFGCRTKAESKAEKIVIRPRVYLGGPGRDSGAETLTYIQRIYFYNTPDCSAGFKSSDEMSPAVFVLSAGVWPNP